MHPVEPIHRPNRRAVLAAGSAALIAAALPGRGLAATFPGMPVKILVGNPPGGPADTLARLIGAEFSKGWRQPVVVENVTGASGAIAMGNLARSAPDGHFLAILNFNTLVFELLSKAPPFMLARDTTPIGGIARQSQVLVTTPSLPVKTVAELIAYAKAHPRQLAYASGGYGSPAHMAGELFCLRTGTEMLHVPYKGASPAIQDVIAGTVPLAFGSAAASLPQIEAGRLRPLAVTGERRLANLPAIPTLVESGADVVVRDWFGLIGPARLDPAARERIDTDLRAVLQRPETKAQIESIGSEVASASASEFALFTEAEQKKWRGVIANAHITMT